MGKVGFPLDALEFENRTSTSTAQFIHSGSVRPPNEKLLISKIPPIMKYFYVYLLIGKRVQAHMMNLIPGPECFLFVKFGNQYT